VLERGDARDRHRDVRLREPVPQERRVDDEERLHGDENAHERPVVGHLIQRWMPLPDQLCGPVDLADGLAQHSLGFRLCAVGADAKRFGRAYGLDLGEQEEIGEHDDPVDRVLVIAALLVLESRQDVCRVEQGQLSSRGTGTGRTTKPRSRSARCRCG
jgi:hypothetical protein